MRPLPTVLLLADWIRSIIAYSLRAPASVEPLPNSETMRAGTTNSPSASRAGWPLPMVAGIESDTPSPGPRNNLPPSEYEPRSDNPPAARPAPEEAPLPMPVPTPEAVPPFPVPALPPPGPPP
jgi:hypothetical protein